jgi:hypothetical protein
MTKQQFKSSVKGIFSVRWLKNDGSERYLHRCILGLNKKVEGQPFEHNDYVLVYKIGNGYGEQRRWGNVNPNTITSINGVAV